jgi:uncharacterized MAPEG superfamily protein
MNATALALTGYIAWFLALLLALGGARAAAVLSAHRAPNSFKPDGSDLSPFAARLTRAHANCYEGFPFFGGSLLLALATGSTAITDPLALVALACRVGQSTVHLISTSAMAVNLRFSFLLAQIGIVAYWLVKLYGKFAGA